MKLSSYTVTGDDIWGSTSFVNSLINRINDVASATATNSDSVVLLVIGCCFQHIGFPHINIIHLVVDLNLSIVSFSRILGVCDWSESPEELRLESEPKSASTYAHKSSLWLANVTDFAVVASVREIWWGAGHTLVLREALASANLLGGRPPTRDDTAPWCGWTSYSSNRKGYFHRGNCMYYALSSRSQCSGSHLPSTLVHRSMLCMGTVPLVPVVLVSSD